MFNCVAMKNLVLLVFCVPFVLVNSQYQGLYGQPATSLPQFGSNFGAHSQGSLPNSHFFNNHAQGAGFSPFNNQFSSFASPSSSLNGLSHQSFSGLSGFNGFNGLNGVRTNNFPQVPGVAPSGGAPSFSPNFQGLIQSNPNVPSALRGHPGLPQNFNFNPSSTNFNQLPSHNFNPSTNFNQQPSHNLNPSTNFNQLPNHNFNFNTFQYPRPSAPAAPEAPQLSRPSFNTAYNSIPSTSYSGQPASHSQAGPQLNTQFSVNHALPPPLPQPAAQPPQHQFQQPPQPAPRAPVQAQIPHNYGIQPTQELPSNQIVDQKNYQPAPVHYASIGPELKGDYKFGYHTGDKGSFREESRLPDGTVQGAYGYIDNDGKQQIVKYSAGVNGFQVLNDSGKPNGQQAASVPAPAQSAPQPAARPAVNFDPQQNPAFASFMNDGRP